MRRILQLISGQFILGRKRHSRTEISEGSESAESVGERELALIKSIGRRDLSDQAIKRGQLLLREATMVVKRS